MGKARDGARMKNGMEAVATTKRDYYDVLGVKRAADENELRRAFRKSGP